LKYRKRNFGYKQRFLAFLVWVVLGTVMMPFSLPWMLFGFAQTPSALVKRIALRIVQRKIDPASRLIRVKQGEALELVFQTDEVVDLHLHGYNRAFRVKPGEPAVLTLSAHIAGRFAIEAHRFAGNPSIGLKPKSNEITLLYLEVYPR
jgi:hypothetical protein